MTNLFWKAFDWIENTLKTRRTYLVTYLMEKDGGTVWGQTYLNSAQPFFVSSSNRGVVEALREYLEKNKGTDVIIFDIKKVRDDD